MPRALPWLAEMAKSNKHTSSSPAPRKRGSSPDELVDEDLNTTGAVTSERRKRSRPARTPSTSPPPAPPDVECMHAGFSADDAWVMVEDEFLTTAKMYTQHIHHAEYVRLKRLARSRGQGTLQAIARPTDGRTAQSNGLRLRREAEATSERIQNGLRRVLGEEDSEDDDPFMLDPQLAGLMTGSGSLRATHDLSGLAVAKANTRAAAGFAKSPQKQRVVDRDGTTAGKRHSESPTSRRKIAPALSEDESTDSDDLDAVKQTKPNPKHNALPSNVSVPVSNGKENQLVRGTGLFKRFATVPTKQPRPDHCTETPSDRATASRPTEERSNHGAKVSSSMDKGFTFQRSERSQSASNYLAKRRAAKEKAEQEEKHKANHVVDVPTFLI